MLQSLTWLQYRNGGFSCVFWWSMTCVRLHCCSILIAVCNVQWGLDTMKWLYCDITFTFVLLSMSLVFSCFSLTAFCTIWTAHMLKFCCYNQTAADSLWPRACFFVQVYVHVVNNVSIVSSVVEQYWVSALPLLPVCRSFHTTRSLASTLDCIRCCLSLLDDSIVADFGTFWYCYGVTCWNVILVLPWWLQIRPASFAYTHKNMYAWHSCVKY